MNRRIWGLTAGLLLTVVLVGSGAHATTFGANPGGNGGSGGSFDLGKLGRSVTVFQSFRVVTGNNNTLTVLRTCTATATPAPAATVVHCYLKGKHNGGIYDNTTHVMSGPLSTVEHTVTVPTQPYFMCIRGWGIYGDGSYLYSPKTGDLCQ